MKIRAKNVDTDLLVDMTIWRALRVVYWRVFCGHTWRRISEMWCDRYLEHMALSGNQIHGMVVLDCAAITLGLKSYVSWPLN